MHVFSPFFPSSRRPPQFFANRPLKMRRAAASAVGHTAHRLAAASHRIPSQAFAAAHYATSTPPIPSSKAPGGDVAGANGAAAALPPKPPSAVVADYWEDVMRFSHEPESYTLGHPAEAHGAPVDRDAMPRSPATQPDEKAVRQLLAGVVKTRREFGDIWPSLITRQCCEFYERLDDPGRAKFLRMLVKDFDIDLQETAFAVQQFEETLSKSDRTVIRASQRLREVTRPAYETFFSRINQLPGGMRFLVNLRADILSFLAKFGSDLHLRALNESLKSKLQEWFGMGFLDLERITWNSPASVLEKIVHYEAVHEISSWDALKQRLGPGRLCYAFFHRGMPHEPLTFVQVALVDEVSSQVQKILDDTSPETRDPKVAIFYSITSSQRGLSGIDLGNFLIKRVVKEIQLHHPTIETFCTLSPIPNFKSWLLTAVQGEMSTTSSPKLPQDGKKASGSSSGSGTRGTLLLPEEEDVLRSLIPDKNPIEALHAITSDIPWLQSPTQTQSVRPIIERLCSRYLLLEKKRSLAFDPVANFHIRNGASLYRINWGADTSEKGIAQSFGLMANYNYNLPQVELNNQKYLLDGRISVCEPDQPGIAWAHEQQMRMLARRVDDVSGHLHGLQDHDNKHVPKL